MAIQVDVSCNPVSSFNALHSLDSSSGKHNPQELKKAKAEVLSSQAATDSDGQCSSKKGAKPHRMLCDYNRHQLHIYFKFIEMSMEEWQNYVK